MEIETARIMYNGHADYRDVFIFLVTSFNIRTCWTEGTLSREHTIAASGKINVRARLAYKKSMVWFSDKSC